MTNSIKNSFFSGISWTIFQIITSKLISFFTQIILAWLLLPEDFGKISIAVSINSVISLVQALGITDVLISRGHMFNKLINLSKSISLLSALTCVVISLITSYIAGVYLYNDIEITYLILIFTFSVPFNALSIVPDAKLRINLQFKKLSILSSSLNLFSNTLLIILVLINFGIYSFVLAPLISSIFRFFIIHKIAVMSIFFSFNLNHYRYLLSNSFYGFFHNLFQTFIRTFDYLIIGLFVSVQSVGIYFMGYTLSVQAIGLLVNSVTPVFFPVLKKIPKSDTVKTKKILIKILYTFSILGMCFSTLQFAIAEPIIKLLLKKEWFDSIIILQILSFGMGFNICTQSLWTVSLTLKDKFFEQAKLSFQSLIGYLILIILGTKFYGILGTALFVTLYYIIFGLYQLNSSFKNFDISFYLILKIIFKYFIFSVFVFGIFYYFSLIFFNNLWLKLLVSGLVPLFFYFYLLYTFDTSFKIIFEELKNKFVSLINKSS